MKRDDFIDKIGKVDSSVVNEFKKLYSKVIPEKLSVILSAIDEVIFFDDGYRLMAMKEIIIASDEYEVDFIDKGLVPIIDCYDNTFIVYCLDDDKWAMFNIIDESLFKVRNELKELL